jgi:hypothetical protein
MLWVEQVAFAHNASSVVNVVALPLQTKLFFFLMALQVICNAM